MLIKNAKKWNRDIVLLIIALAVLAFTFFRMPRNKIKSAPVTILTFTHSWEGREGLLNELKAGFEEQNSGIKIELQFLPYDRLAEILRKAGQSDPEFALPGQIIAVDKRGLSELRNNDSIETEIFPLLRFYNPLFYNTEILSVAGFNRPPKTRTEFLAMAKQIADPQTGIYAVAFALDNHRGITRDICGWIWASGILLENSGQVSQRDITALESVLEFLTTLEKEKLILPDMFNINEDEKRESFIEGKIAFYIGSAQDLEMLFSAMGNKLGFTAIPAPDTYIGKPLFGSDSWNLVIPKTAHTAEAALFARYLSEHNYLLAKNWAIIAEAMEYSAEMFYEKAAELYISGELIDDFTEIPMRTAETIIIEEIKKLFDETQNAGETAKNIFNHLTR